MVKLSEKQRIIVDHLDGSILVKAGPGSGKTRVLIERIKRILLSKSRCKVLALTFSNFAADEMKNRIFEDNEMANYADNVTVSTIHAFALDIVQTRGNLIGLKSEIVIFENDDDRKAILREVFTNNPNYKNVLMKQQRPDYFLDKCLNLISEQKRKFILPELCSSGELFPLVYKEYNEQLLSQNAIDFDDILLFTYRIFIENPSVVKLYTSIFKYICVDEAQDLNYAQYEVIKALCGSEFKNIMFVGDENQSIYGFNGSDSSLMSKNFVVDFSPTIYTLNENFRSAKKIVAFSNKLKEGDNITNYIYEGELEVFRFDDEEKEADFVLQKIRYLLQNGHNDIENTLSYDDFAVIGRNRYVLHSIQQRCIESNTPFFFRRTISNIENESEYMRAFDLGLRLIINPLDDIHFRELCKLIDITPNKNKITDINSFNGIFENRFSTLLAPLKLAASDNFDFKKVLDAIKENIPKDYTEDDKYLIENDILQWNKHWQKYSTQIQREYRSLLSFRNCISLGKTQDITSETGVSLLSAHMSKGLQYNVVFILGLSEGTFPDYRAKKEKELEQEKNNMYVAVTRAKRICYLTYPETKLMPWGAYKMQVPSRYIKDLLDEKKIDK